MSRLARRMQVARLSAPTLPSPADMRELDTALRGRAARSVRARLRRMEPVVLTAPPWAGVPRFLEDLSLDLAVGEPAVGCRAVSFRPVHGRPRAEAWQLTLQLFGQLGQRGWHQAAPSSVADRRGFRWALEERIEAAHASSPHRVALLARDVEHLPVELLEDVAMVWSDYRERHAVDRRCTVLLATTDSADWLNLASAPKVELVDFADAEAVSSIVGRCGPMPVADLAEVARLTGGVPGLIEKVSDVARRTGALPVRPADLLECLGPVAGELRAAVDQAIAHDPLADRLMSLRPGELTEEEPEVDVPLLRAGLLRKVRSGDGPRIALRAAVLRHLIG